MQKLILIDDYKMITALQKVQAGKIIPIPKLQKNGDFSAYNRKLCKQDLR